MLWACFSRKGKSPLKFVSGNIDSSHYCAILGTSLLPFVEHHHPHGALFQQDNAPCHTSAMTREWFFDMEVAVLNWPSRSPDLNPIENLWGMLAQKVYNNGRQFDCVDDLKEALVMAWDSIELSTLQNLVQSMTNRLLTVVERRGGPTPY